MLFPVMSHLHWPCLEGSPKAADTQLGKRGPHKGFQGPAASGASSKSTLFSS